MKLFESFGKYRLREDQLFNSESILIDLAGKSVRGGIITFASTGIMLLVNLGRTMVLARLLTPVDFGIIGMVAVFINFVSIFKDAGLSIATVQQSQISHEQISKLAWLNLIITAILGFVIAVSSPLIALIYDNDDLVPVTLALSISFVIEGFTIQHRALLRRHMRFISLNIITILSSLIGIVVSILLALCGWRYWALITGTIATAISEGILIYFFCPWLPGKYSRETNIRSMFGFGMNITASSALLFLARQADKMIIGIVAGASQLGLYDKAYQLSRMPADNILSPIRTVSMPALSAIQTESVQYTKYFQGIINLTATFIFPLSFYFYIEADFLILTMLGSQWKESIPLFKLLALGGFIQPIIAQSGIVMMSMGNARRYLQWQIFHSISLLLAFIIGIQYGVLGLAAAYAITEFVVFVPSLLHNYKQSPIKPYMVLKVLSIPVLISLISALVLLLIKYLIVNDEIIYHVAYAIIFFCTYLMFSWRRMEFRSTILLLISKLK